MVVCMSPETAWVEKNPADSARTSPVAAAPARTHRVSDSSLDMVWRLVGLLCDISLSLPFALAISLSGVPLLEDTDTHVAR